MSTFVKLFLATLFVSVSSGTALVVDCTVTNVFCTNTAVESASVLSTSVDTTEPALTILSSPTPTLTITNPPKKILPTKIPPTPTVVQPTQVPVQNNVQTNFVWPTMKPLPTLYLPPANTDAIKKMQDLGNAPLVVPTIDASIHVSNPEPTPIVPFGFSN